MNLFSAVSKIIEVRINYQKVKIMEESEKNVIF